MTPRHDPAAVPQATCAPRTWVVAREHPRADDSNPGTPDRPLLTIQAAAQQAQPGDTVLIRAGEYRELIVPPRGGEAGRPIAYAAAPDEPVVVKGSDRLAGPWRPVAGAPGVFECDLEFATRDAYNPFAVPHLGMPGRLNCGQVFFDGLPLGKAGDRAEALRLPGFWMTPDEGRTLIVHVPPSASDPARHCVEAAVRRACFRPDRRGLGYLVVRGIVFEQAANPVHKEFWSKGHVPQSGMLSCRSGHHWTVEGCELRWANATGIDVGMEGQEELDGQTVPCPRHDARSPVGYHTIRGNAICDNGECGLCGLGHTGTHIVGNRIEGNNRYGTSVMEEAGIKTHFFFDGLIEGNLIRDNHAVGIWLDNVWRGTRVSRNVVVGNAGAALFIEMGDGPLLVDNNVFGWSYAADSLPGDGVYAHDSSRVSLAHNLIAFNANFGVWNHIGTERTTHVLDKGKVPCEAGGWNVANNLVIGNGRGAISFPTDHERSRGNRSEHNLLAANYDLVTAETWGAPLDAPLFLVNTNKDRIPRDELVRRFEAAVAQAGIPPERRPGAVLYAGVPLLTLELWRALTGCDRLSLVPVLLRPRFEKCEMLFGFTIDDSPARVGCPPVPGVERDLFGRPLGERPLPGPFQDLKLDQRIAEGADGRYERPNRGRYERLPADDTNRNLFRLWPLPEVKFYRSSAP